MSGFFDPFLEMARVQRDINRLFGDANRSYLDNYCGTNTRPALEGLLDIVIPNDVPTARTKDTSQLQSTPQQQQQQQQQQQLACQTPWRNLLMPRLDVWEKDNQTCVQLEVPGFAKDKLNIEVNDGYLHISGEVHQEEKKEHHNLLHSERRFGSFKRSIRLPKNCKEDAIQASFTDGLLQITVPHAEEPKTKKRLINITENANNAPQN